MNHPTTNVKTACLLLLLSAACLCSADTTGIAVPSGPVQVLRITPQGDTYSYQRQIVVQFDRPMIVLGAAPPRLKSVLVSIKPSLDCNWHWVNPTTLTCELGERGGASGSPGYAVQAGQGGLAPATSYQVVVKAGIKALDGSALPQNVTSTFITEKPKVRYAYLMEWSGPTSPLLEVDFNLPVTQSSVESHVYFESSAGRTPISAKVDPNDNRDFYVIPASGGAPVHIVPKPNPNQVSDDESDDDDPSTPAPGASTQTPVTVPAGEQARYDWLIGVASMAKPLPGGALITLMQEPGLATPLGPELGDSSSRLLHFQTYGDFAFSGIWCSSAGDFDPSVPLNDIQTPCNPQNSMALVFTSPVQRKELEPHIKTWVEGKSVDLIGYVPPENQWEDSLGENGQSFRVYFPLPLKAYASYRVEISSGMKDVWGRVLTKAQRIGFRTTHRSPELRIDESAAILEQNVDSDVPLYVTNLQSLLADYTRLYLPGLGKRLLNTLSGHGSGDNPITENQTLTYALPAVKDMSLAMPLETRKMLEGHSGVVYGTLNPTPVFPNQTFRFFAEVTPFNVQVKVGHFNTLVWVTDYADGRPVKGASVDIYTGYPDALGDAPSNPRTAMTDASGIAMLPGGVVLDPTMTLRQTHYGENNNQLLIVRVRRGTDLALIPLDEQFKVNTYSVSHYQVWENLRKRYGHLHAWGTTAEGIYRAGDTIQYKIFVRDQDNHRFVPPPAVGYTVTLEDPTGNTVMNHNDVKLSAFGTCDGEYKVPANAPVGWYTFHITANGLEDVAKSDTLSPMRVLVSDFTPAPFHVDTSINGTRFEPGDPVEVTTTARLHAGGPYTQAQGRNIVTLKAADFTSNDPVGRDFTFSSYDSETNESQQTINETTGVLDNQGTFKVDFKLKDAGIYYGKLLVEGDVRDERGKYIASVTGADYLGRDRFVGLRLNQWVLHAGKQESVDYLVVDGSGKPVADSPVQIRIERLDLKASRVKGPGNAYLTQYVRNWVASGSCDVVSTTAPGACKFTPDAPGEFRIEASVTDTHGRVHRSSMPAWAAGAGEVVWEDKDDGALNIISEQTQYHVGDTARYLLQNPYPGAEALITIERYGILKHWVQKLEGSTPIISFPVEPDYLPGVFLSVTVMSPRVAKPLGPGKVDLGKPAFRTGYLEVPVLDSYKILDIKVTTPKDTYKPRDKVTVQVRAKPLNGRAGKVELAIAVLDDSVFDLLSSGKDYFDPYKGFYTLDGLDLTNFNLITRLVGRRVFEKKGATPGGGGGATLSLRSLFKFVSYWNPALDTDGAGNAQFSFTVPDNLTAWRILVLGVNRTDRMGLGQTVIKVNRPTELRPIMPNQVVEGDSFRAGFSVMNRTTQVRDLKVHVTATGVVQGAPELNETVHVEPYKRAEVWLPVVTTTPGTVKFTATAGDKIDSDGLIQLVPVERAVTLVTLSQYGSGTAPVNVPMEYPPDALPGSVELSVNLAPTVIGNLRGAFAYMRDYPYLCWEQQLTKAVMAANFKRLSGYLGNNVAWKGSDPIPGETLANAAAFQAPDGGMAYWVAEDRYTDPYLSAYTALAFNWLRQDGYTIPDVVEQKLHVYLKNFLKGNAVPDYYTLGMRSSVRAVALAALAADHDTSLDDLNRFAPYMKDMSLFGKAWFMQAALDINGSDLATQDLKLILNQSNETGGKFEFSESLDDGFRRILSTPLRSNCAILSALTRYAQSNAADANMVADVPFKLVRSITQIRGDRDHWENTQENLFCMQALADYARAYEKTAPDYTVTVTAGEHTLGSITFKSMTSPAAHFTQPLAQSTSAKQVPVKLARGGSGRLYYALGLTYAPKSLPNAINDGIEIHREYSVQRNGKWVLLKSPMVIARGELVRVDLYVSVPAAREFVVVDDPVPGGLEPVDQNLATSSVQDVNAGHFQAAAGAFWFNFDDWEDYGEQFWDFYHEELRHDSARFYADYLPGGHYHLSYSAQAIAAGSFTVQPVKVEEMYDPDVFGLGASAVLKVTDQLPPQ